MVHFQTFILKSIAFASIPSLAVSQIAEQIRNKALRLRNPDSTTVASQSISDSLPDAGNHFRLLAGNDHMMDVNGLQQVVDSELDLEKIKFDTLFHVLQVNIGMSMLPSDPPSSVLLSSAPSVLGSTLAPTPTKTPSSTGIPTASPTISTAPTNAGTTNPTTEAPSPSPTETPQVADLTDDPTSSPTPAPTNAPTNAPTLSPTPVPTIARTNSPTAPLTPDPTSSPTYAGCGVSLESRNAAILAMLDQAANATLIRDNTTPQGMATTWLLEDDELRYCPDQEKLLQRWVMAVIYFSVGGNGWEQCSGNPAALDTCGMEQPFVGKRRFLSGTSECNWAGISCIHGCVTQIEFEENNVAGSIPTEIGLLGELQVWGMEQGDLSGTIPTEVGNLQKLIFIDLDFNNLSGSLPSELFTLSLLQQLDINNNQFTGSIDGIGEFPAMQFLQIHRNDFTGTVPEGVGMSSELGVFTLHATNISGSMPSSVCDLLVTNNNGGVLRALIADCAGTNPEVVCTCCTDCRDL